MLCGTRLSASRDVPNDTTYETNDNNAKRYCSRVRGLTTDEVVSGTDSNRKSEWACKSGRKNQAKEIECI